MEWIRVKDRLPENRNEVIVATKSGVVTTSIYYEDEGDFCFSNVTHWMPLPDLPKY